MTTSQQQQTGWQTAEEYRTAASPRPITVEIPPEWAEQLLRFIAETQTLPAPVPMESIVERPIGTGVLGFIVAGFRDDGDGVPEFCDRITPYATLTDARVAADAEQRLENRRTAKRDPDDPRTGLTFRPVAVIEVTS